MVKEKRGRERRASERERERERRSARFIGRAAKVSFVLSWFSEGCPGKRAKTERTNERLCPPHHHHPLSLSDVANGDFKNVLNDTNSEMMEKKNSPSSRTVHPGTWSVPA